MNKKAIKVLSIIAVVFAIIFAIAITIYFFNTELFGPVLGTISIISGGITVLLYIIVRFALKPKNNIVTEDTPDGGGEPPDENPEGPENPDGKAESLLSNDKAEGAEKQESPSENSKSPKPDDETKKAE